MGCGRGWTGMRERHLPLGEGWAEGTFKAPAAFIYRGGAGVLVARLNLPNMSHPPERRLEVYAAAIRDLTTLEPDPARRVYLDFIDIYSAPDDN